MVQSLSPVCGSSFVFENSFSPFSPFQLFKKVGLSNFLVSSRHFQYRLFFISQSYVVLLSVLVLVRKVLRRTPAVRMRRPFIRASSLDESELIRIFHKKIVRPSVCLSVCPSKKSCLFFFSPIYPSMDHK